MTHHVAVGIVQDDDIVLAALDALHALVADLIGAHLGLEVIGGHLGRGHEAAILTGEGLLHTAIEEEGHMGVLFRLGDAQLGQAAVGNILAEDIV